MQEVHEALTVANKVSSLGPNGGTESPGSSVFDLPIQPSNPPPFDLRSPPPLQRQSSGKAEVNATHVGDASFIVISGGTGGNSICSAFGNTACYVLPVSDDGGSSSEIIRVLGGPSVGECPTRLNLKG